MSTIPSKIKLSGDKTIWIIVGFLSLFSILVVYSSISSLAFSKNESSTSFLIRHIFYISIGLITMYIFHRMPVSAFKNFALIGLVISIMLMIYMLLFGVNLNDGQRWIRIWKFTFQPADIAKISIILYIASALEDNPNFKNFKEVVQKIVVPIGIVVLLIFIGNVSTALLLALICLSTLYIGGMRWVHLWKIAGLSVAALAILFILGVTLKWPPRVVTAISRIETFVSDKKEKTDAPTEKILDKRYTNDYQTTQSKIAIASGGLVGKGPGNSTQRYFLPHPYSDFVYAMIVEEYGIISGILILVAYMSLLYRAAIIAKKCTRIFSSVTVLGLMLMIVFQALVNIGVSVGVFPVTGQPLPFVSMGGSSMLFIGASFGIILSISRTANKQRIKEISDNEIDNKKNEDHEEAN